MFLFFFRFLFPPVLHPLCSTPIPQTRIPIGVWRHGERQLSFEPLDSAPQTSLHITPWRGWRGCWQLQSPPSPIAMMT